MLQNADMLQRAKLIARVAQEAGLTAAQLNAKLEQPSMLRRTPAWVFLGPPGVGKGTYASRVADALGIAHISAGDLVREEIKQQTDLGQQVCQFHVSISGNALSISLKCFKAGSCSRTAAHGGRDNFNLRHVRPRCQRPVCYRALPVIYRMFFYRRP